MSNADKIFKQTVNEILETGEWYPCERGLDKNGNMTYAVWEDGTPAKALGKFCVINRYDLSKEFPILTVRPVPLKLAIDEILWIWQKKSNKVSDLNSHIWDEWKKEDGTIGKAYGYQLGVKHKYKEGWFDQVDRVLFDLKNSPHNRRMVTSIFNHHDLNEMALYPCAYGMEFNVKNGKLNAVLNQRSQDMLAANGINVVQYAILVHMFAISSGLQVGELVHKIVDAHIYDRHIDYVKELIERPEYSAPKLIINPDVKNFYDFTVDDFKLEGYEKGAQIKNIPIAI
ncbi:MAG: thymidylate synthase [Clostridiaceae bacterium]|jgi:thymidylate synthase|nr:thymidylate synthase [Clostridiaceae bacterium]